jgi:AraC-like DNA-binding protein
MKFSFYKPATVLQPYIDIYWQLSGHFMQNEALTLLPAGGVSLFVNLGEDITSTRFETSIKGGNVFIVGPMKQTDVQVLSGEVMLFGINFKPGAFKYFYKYDALCYISDQFLGFDQRHFPDVKKSMRNFVAYLDQFYYNRLSVPKFSMLNIAADISRHRGILKIDSLAKKHCTTIRQLERQFKQEIGLSPKELINLERFTNAYSKLQTRSKESLSEIAWDCGYYDHAHMTNDFKRYTGKTPTDVLSSFSKTTSIELS